MILMLANIFEHVQNEPTLLASILCIANMLQRCANSTTLLANIFMHHQHVVQMGKQHNIVGQHIYASPTCCRDGQTAQHCWPTFLCIANMLQRCANSTTLLANIFMHRQHVVEMRKQHNIVGQHFYASPTCCRDAQTAQHCWPTFLCITNMLQRCANSTHCWPTWPTFMHHQHVVEMRKQHNIVGQHYLCIANMLQRCANSTTLLANIFMHHQHVVEMRKQHNIVGQHFYASPTCCRDGQTAQHCWPTFLCIANMLQRWANSTTLLANIFMHHQHVVEMGKQHNIVGQHFYASPTCCRDAQTAQHCWPTYLCIANMLQRCANSTTLLANIFMHHQHVVEMRKQHNIVGQHFYASPTCCRDAQTAQHCWPTFLCITNMLQRWANSTTLLANIFMHHQHVVEMRKQHNIVGQHFYASPTCCRDAQTAQHCWPTFLCITNMLQRCANSTTLLANIFMHHQHVVEMGKQQNIVGQHIYASPTCCRDGQTAEHCWPTYLRIANMLQRCANSTTLLANIFMHRQHVVEMGKQHNIVGQHIYASPTCCRDGQTAQHCWPTYLCIANMLQRCANSTIVGQHIYASPTCCRDGQTAQHCWPTYLCIANMLQRWANSTTLLANIFMHRQHVVEMRKQHNIVGQHIYASPTCCRDGQTAQHCWPTYLCIANMLQRCANSTTLLANIFMHRQHVVEMRKQHNIVGQHIYASPTCCRDGQTAQHCWPTYLCIANMLQRCANSTTLLANIFMHRQHVVEMGKQHNIVGQHIYASPTCCRDGQTAQHCWPTYLCIANMLQRCANSTTLLANIFMHRQHVVEMGKQHNIVGQHIYASPTCCRDGQTAQHCWPTLLALFAPAYRTIIKIMIKTTRGNNGLKIKN